MVCRVAAGLLTEELETRHGHEHLLDVLEDVVARGGHVGSRDLAWPNDLLSPFVAFADGSGNGRDVVAREYHAGLTLGTHLEQEGKGVPFTFAVMMIG